jgi:DNA polymerase III delta subunit
VHPFVAKKASEQARQFPDLATLEALYRKLAEYDYFIKSGKMGDELAIQLFISAVTR